MHFFLSKKIDAPASGTFFIDILRALAIIFVVNSHLDTIYPYSFLGTGGMFGDQLFFFISGYTLYLSYQHKQRSFFQWIGHRLLRVYEPVLIIGLFFIFIGFKHITSISDFFWTLMASKDYWFLPAIAGFYFPVYFLIKGNISEKTYMALFALLGILYLSAYSILVDKTSWSMENVIYFKCIYYFFVISFGVLVARFYTFQKGRIKDLGILILLTGLFYGTLGLIKYTDHFEYQALAHPIAFMWLIALFRAVQYEPLQLWIKKYFSSVISFLARTTLQIYLLHMFFVLHPLVKEASFPMNIVMVIIPTLILAGLFEKISFAEFTRSTKKKSAEIENIKAT